MDEYYTDFETSRQAYAREDETYLYAGPLPDDEDEADVQVAIAEMMREVRRVAA